MFKNMDIIIFTGDHTLNNFIENTRLSKHFLSPVLNYTKEKCYRILSISAQSMYIIDSNKYAIDFLEYLLFLTAFF